MNAAGLRQNMKTNLKDYVLENVFRCLFRKWVYFAETSHVQEHTFNKHIFFKKQI